jgi:hypothetical protein
VSWAAIAAAIVKGLAALLQWLQNRQLLDAGRAEQRAQDGAERDQAREEADAIDNRVDGASGAELDELRAKWTRPDA